MTATEAATSTSTEASTAASAGARLAPPVGLPRLLPRDGVRTPLAGHAQRYGPLPVAAPGPWLIDLVERSGLRGRGGAAFPTYRKLAAVAGRSVVSGARPGRGAVVVANAAESEPASAKDRALLALAPHLVLDGIAVAAACVGAGEAIVCVEPRSAHAAQSLAAALAERSDPVAVRIVTVPVGYVSGEESALVRWLNGGPAKPTLVPPRPAERGVQGRPTLVDNVETLANLALIARYGDAWYRSVGTAEASGSMLVTAAGVVARPGVLEVSMGTTVGDVLAAAGGATEQLSAVLLGGYFGLWHRPDAALARPVDLSVGAGIILAFPASACGLVALARLARWLAGQSAGQCGPCVNGLPAIADGVAALAAGQVDGQVVNNLKRRLALTPGRGLCHLPDGATRVVASGLNLFSREIQAHAGGWCTARSQSPVLPLPAT